MTLTAVAVQSEVTTSPPDLPETQCLYSTTLILLAVGVLIVSIGYALSRASGPGAIDFYFIGEFILALAPIVFICSNKAISNRKGLWISVYIGMATFMLILCYSPLAFAFNDEYQHVLTARSILATGHLFHQNTALPISSQFPGMEIVTTELSSLSGLSIFVSGMIVAGVSHVLMTALAYCLGKEVGLSSRTALFAVVLFTTGYTYQAFLSYFAYETFAVPFLIAVLIAILKTLKSKHFDLLIFGVAAVTFSFVTAVSHHITGFLLGGLAIVIGASTFFLSPRWRYKPSIILLLFLPILASLFFWNFVVATETVHYLSQIKNEFFGVNSSPIPIASPTLQLAEHVFASGRPIVDNTPAPLRLLSYLGVGVVVLLMPLGAWSILRKGSRYGLDIWAMPLLAALVYCALVPIFFLTSGGSGLVGRGQVLLLIPGGLVAAVALDGGWLDAFNYFKARKESRFWRIAPYFSVVLALVVVAGAVPGSYPPYSSKLPAPYNIDATTRSYDEHTLQAANWVGSFLGPKARIAADSTDASMLNAIAGVPSLDYTANLFETADFTASNVALIRHGHISYVFANQRLISEIPAGGSNFYRDPLTGLYAHPLPSASLYKFNNIPGVSRIFDDGAIVIYQINGSAAAASAKSGA